MKSPSLSTEHLNVDIYDIIRDWSLEDYIREEKTSAFIPGYKDEDSRATFYFYSQIYAIMYSRLDIIKYLDSEHKLPQWTSQCFGPMCEANNPDIIDFYLNTKNIKIMQHQFKFLEVRHPDSGILEKIEQRSLRLSIPPDSAPTLPPPLKI